jgi:hypothetical protein
MQHYGNTPGIGGGTQGDQTITCSLVAVDNLSAWEGQAKDLSRWASLVAAGRGSMRIGDTGMQAMHHGGVVAAAAGDSAPAAGTTAARRTGCAKIQQSLEGDGRFGVAATGDIAGVENQQVVDTAPERVRAWSEEAAQQRIGRTLSHSALVFRSSLRVPMLPEPSAL